MNTATELKHLFTPHKILDIEIKNRIVFLPHWPGYSRDGMPTDTTMNYYVERAKGGVGLVVLESMSAHPKGQMSPGYIFAYDKRVIPPFRQMSKRIHDRGAKVFGQLTHCGSTVLVKPPQLMFAPTQMPEPGSRYNAKELELDEIAEIIRYFGLSAETQREAGIDGVELKVAHDGLLRGFAAPFSNRRDDEYGGNFQKRMRLLYEVIAEIRKKVGNDYPVGIRLSLDEFTQEGYSLDFGVKLAKALEEAGADYISADAGTQGAVHMQLPPMCIPLSFGIYMSAAVKKAVDIPVIAFGRINDPVQAETILAEGNADFIGMCRQLVCDPETPNKAMEGRLDDIRHCIACNDGCLFQVIQDKPIRCIQNPATGREAQLGIGTVKPAEKKKRIMVIGGGVGGMKFAEVAASRGHDVELYEKENILGGQINIAEKLPYRLEISEVTRFIKLQLDKYRVPVHLDEEVSVDKVNEIAPDIVVVATGSYPHLPDLPGFDKTNIKIMDVRQALLNPESIRHNVVVLDKNGHWPGAGINEYILALGAKVHCVTPHAKLGIDMEPGSLELLMRRLFDDDHDFEIMSFCDIQSVGENTVTFKHLYSKKETIIPGIDTLVIADRSVSDNKLYLQLKKGRKDVYAVGDCAAPRMIEQVIFESDELGRKI